jgi:hypothetical protein
MAYATLAELKGFVGIPEADEADDTTLSLALDAASGQVDAFCDRTFAADAAPTTRLYRASVGGYLNVDPIATTTGLTVESDNDGDGVFEVAWTLDVDYRLEPVNAAAAGEPWTRIIALGTQWFPRLPYRPGVQVTAAFGWPGGQPPPAVKNAVLIQASRLWKRKDAPFGVAGSVEFGSEMRLLAKLDPDVETLLRPFRRLWAVV